MKYLFVPKGILALSPTLVDCFGHSGVMAESSDLQMAFTPASCKDGVKGVHEDEPGMSVPTWQQRTESRGYMRLRSRDSFDAHLIQTNYRRRT